MTNIYSALDTTGIGVHIKPISSFAEKNLHLEDKRWELPVLSATEEIASVSFDFINDHGFSAIHELIVKQNELEINHFNRVVGGCSLYFSDLLDIEEELSWSNLQSRQAKHDFDYHPDVVNPGPRHHIAHNALHLAVVNGKILESLIEGDSQRLVSNYTDALIFSIKCVTAMGKKLPDTPCTELNWGYR